MDNREQMIYESPDGGHTIYVRKSGEPHTSRRLHSESDTAKFLRQEQIDAELWRKIRQAARTNPTLQRALDEAVLIYKLSE